MPLFPPSLPPDVRVRSFEASNGEIAVRVEDAEQFLSASKKDNLEVLGWELWLADHAWDEVLKRPRKVSLPGFWCGLIPDIGSGVGGMYAGEGNAFECASQINALDFKAGALGAWQDHLRINFTLTREIHLDAARWSSKEDFYGDLLPQLGAPAWHGHNLDALMDGVSGDIYAIQRPYTVCISGIGALSRQMREFLVAVEAVFTDVRFERGVEVSIRFDEPLAEADGA